ncbi:uncharacterized protein FA14DRAFT_143118 [Meira miltonrushii]|uniref:Amino acid permease/ SLC12A domain-containing protein n=1 Tax=Meira miltonrushii TaxID=1280837 RepID=A0A316VL31_9BASI|nr:uncharacterized protein FA14DRAFT_143118 [Meira miltonrushii]PWN38227.1 hypothetical protein FA14DRAFT_143118 [Meira miltonrushii]
MHVLSLDAQAHLRNNGVIESRSVPRKLGTWDGVFMPVSLNILGIILFLRFGFILGQVGLIGALLLLTISYAIDALTAMSVSAISTNGQVRGGGAYYLISRSLGPEFGGAIGLVFFLGQALNAAMNVLGFVESLTDAFGESRDGFLPEGPWWNFSYGSVCLLLSTLVCLVGSAFFKRATLALAVVLGLAILSIPVSSFVVKPFIDLERGAYYTGWSLKTFENNLLPHFTSGAAGSSTGPLKENWQTVFGVLFPAVTGLLAGVSMSGDLRKPSKSIPKGTNWSLIFTYGVYVLCFLVFAGTISRQSFYLDVGIVSDVALSPQLITFGVLASTAFSALMGVMACGKILQAIARDDLLPVLDVFAQGTEVNDTPIYAVVATWIFCQAVLFVDSVNLIAQLVTMTSLSTFGTLSFATLALKAGGAPSFRPSFRYWNIWTAGAGTLLSFGAMFFTEPYAASGCIVLAVFLFSAIHLFCPPKPWGDVTRNLNYHIVRKYLLRLDERKGRVTHWRPQILLLANNPRTDWNLIIFCNSLKKGALYVLGHVLKGEFNECLFELRKQQIAWLKLVDVSGIKSFVNLNIAHDEREGARNLILSCGLGGMRPNIVCLGFPRNLPKGPIAEAAGARTAPIKKDDSEITIRPGAEEINHQSIDVRTLPTDVGRKETPIQPSTFVGILEDALALQKALAVAYGFENMSLGGPSTQYRREQKAKGEEEDLYIDLWPVQIQSPEADQSHAWDTYTMILQLGTILSMTGSWKNHKLRVSVFVEFEQEIEEERRRVRSLLDNLRVPATLRVFSLSAEQVTSYACIVRGKEPVPKPIEVVLAGDPWWEMLKSLRKEEERRQQEKAEKRKSNAQPVPGSSSSTKRQSKRDQKLLGVSLPKEHLDFFQHNMQIGLAHPRAARRSRSESDSESETSASESDSDGDLSDELARLDLDDIDFLSSSAGSNNNGLRRAQTFSTGGNQPSRGQRTSSNMRRRRGGGGRPQRTRTYEGQIQRDLANVGSYGSMSSTPRPSTFRNSTIHEVAAAEEEASDPDGTLRASDRARIQAALQQKPKLSSRNTKDGTPPASRPRSLSSVSDVSIYDGEEGAGRGERGDKGTSRSQHGKSLVTFNQLPNKAQYLILNELIRTNSSASTSVVLTALPAPEAGTSQDPNRSLRYLQHLENLFSGGPPVLGVHAKQLTMTSAL